MGYESGKHYIYLNTDYKDIDCIIFKVFSEDIIAVLSDYSGSTLPKRIINRYLVDYNYFVEYNAYFWESDLDNAINNRLYSKEFMREVLHLPFKQYKTQNIILDKKHSYKYTFDDDNILIFYETSNGLSRYAKEFQHVNPAFYNEMSTYIRSYWGQNNSGYIKELNMQFEAFYHLSNGWKNEFLDLFYILRLILY